MNERIKKIRKALDLTQQKFADCIGSTQNVLANYETGRRNPSNSVINNICKTFHVNESWLRTGEGEMFSQETDNLLDALAQKYGLSHSVRTLVEEFINLKPNIQQAFVDYAVKVARSLAENNAADTQYLESTVPPMTVEEAEAEYIKSKSASAQKTDLNASSSTAAEKSKLA